MKSIILRLSLVCIGLVAAVCISEVVLRIIPNSIGYTDNGLIRIPWFIAEYDFDSEIGFWPKPNQKFKRTTECYDIEQITFNSLGMRSTWEPNKARAQRRIAVLGDSIVQALQVSDQEHFSAIIERIFPGSEVLNFGVSSTGSIQQFLTYEKRIAPLKPDLVIQVLFVGNDIFDNSAVIEGCYTQQEAATIRPYYNADGSISRPSKTVPKRFYEEATSTKQSLHNFLTNYSFVYNALFIARAEWIKKVSPTIKDTPVPCPCWPYTPELVPMGSLTAPADQYWEQAWEDTFRAIKALRDRLDTDGVEYILVIAPDMPLNLSKYRKLLATDKYQNINDQKRDYSIEYAVSRLEQFALNQGIQYVSLLPVFKNYGEKYLVDPKISTISLTLRCDAHLNPLGHLLAAAAVTEKILQLDKLKVSADEATMTKKLIDNWKASTPQSLLGETAYQEIYNGGIYHGRSDVNELPKH